MPRKKEFKRLPIRFHQTFIPEKKYIAVLLKFAASGGQGTDQEIAANTGIPVGKSSGKVPAMLNYAVGMGLLTILKGANKGSKRPELTDFGRSALLEDPDLSESLSQWMAHLHLCRIDGGAEIWHLTFGQAFDVLGTEFSENDLEAYLSGILKKRSRSLIGPMIRMYEEPAAFKTAGILSRAKTKIKRNAAPILKGYVNGYAAFLLSLWDRHFPKARQVTLTDFESVTSWQRVCNWDDRQIESILEMLYEKGAIDIDRQVRPWILIRKSDAKPYWRMLYEDLA